MQRATYAVRRRLSSAFRVLALLFSVLALVNVRGVKPGARLIEAMTLAKLIPLLVLIWNRRLVPSCRLLEVDGPSNGLAGGQRINPSDFRLYGNRGCAGAKRRGRESRANCSAVDLSGARDHNGNVSRHSDGRAGFAGTVDVEWPYVRSGRQTCKRSRPGGRLSSSIKTASGLSGQSRIEVSRQAPAPNALFNRHPHRFLTKRLPRNAARGVFHLYTGPLG